MAQRMLKALGQAGNIYMKLGLSSAPLIIPIIPGYTNDTLEMCASELSKGYAKELSPQIASMIDNARTIIQERTGQTIDSQIFDYGHSKESTFANNFAALFPEKAKCLIVGGDEFFTLPIDEIRLRVVDEISENEEFEVKDGVPYTNITQEQLETIIKEYSKQKKEHQKEILQNDDGSYSIPMNYPLGIADIEHYIDISRFSMGKEEYKRILAKIPRMIFVGENEEEITGHFAYQEGVTQKGVEYDYADDLYEMGYDKEKNPLYEVEKASMHNRVLEYKRVTKILFGRSANERLQKFVKLCEQLGMDIQDKIYKGTGHQGILTKDVSEDMKIIYNSAKEGKTIPQLGNQARAERIRPIFQLIRRSQVCRDEKEAQRLAQILPQLPQQPQPDKNGNKDWETYDKQKEKYYSEVEELEKRIYTYISSKYAIIKNNTNMDRLFDSLTTQELIEVFTREKETKKSYKIAESEKYVTGRRLGQQVRGQIENVTIFDKTNDKLSRESRSISQTKEENIGE